jgi:hypothetical protein
MDTVQILGSAMGLGLLAGIRLYATVFALGLAIRMGWFHLSSAFSHLDVLAQTPVLVLSGAAFVVEFFADKIPWLDSMWDSIHTFIRPVGAAVLGATALGSFDPTTRFLIALMCGGIAFTGHTSKAATRLVANHSPEPFSNIGLSFLEDLAVPVGLWVAFDHPKVAIALVCVFLVLFVWLAPRIFRLLIVSWTALRTFLFRVFGDGPKPVPPSIPDHVNGTVRRALEEVPFQGLPLQYANKGDGKWISGIHCVATGSVKGLRNSTGYLCTTAEDLVFVARRMFRVRTCQIPWGNIQEATLRRGLFLDSLVLKTSDGEFGFDVFKTRRAGKSEGLTHAWHAR